MILQQDHKCREEVAMLLTKAFCLGIDCYIRPLAQVPLSGRADEISNAFLELVRQHCMKERELAFYADRLCISIKYLSSMVHASIMKTPSKWIEEYTVLKSQQLLSTTKEPVGIISEMLSFNSPSDFSKYFRRYTGMTPSNFRTTLH